MINSKAKDKPLRLKPQSR